MAIVYQHRRVDTNQVFYIGIGMTEKRAASHRVRNKMWHSVVEKAGGFEYDVIHHSLSWSEACAEERNLIAEYCVAGLFFGLSILLRYLPNK